MKIDVPPTSQRRAVESLGMEGEALHRVVGLQKCPIDCF
jgi:hypothetical protein